MVEVGRAWRWRDERELSRGGCASNSKCTCLRRLLTIANGTSMDIHYSEDYLSSYISSESKYAIRSCTHKSSTIHFSVKSTAKTRGITKPKDDTKREILT